MTTSMDMSASDSNSFLSARTTTPPGDTCSLDELGEGEVLRITWGGGNNNQNSITLRRGEVEYLRQYENEVPTVIAIDDSQYEAIETRVTEAIHDLEIGCTDCGGSTVDHQDTFTASVGERIYRLDAYCNDYRSRWRPVQELVDVYAR